MRDIDSSDQLQSIVSNSESAIRNPQSAFTTLRRFVRERAPVERCELCSAELAIEHQHLIEPINRQMVCACDPCAILFSGGVEKKYRRVPRRVRYLPEFQLTDAQWDSLAIPIQMAFFFHSTSAGKVVALYPGPAGATESLLDLESWDCLVRDNAILKSMEPDVEALLVNRVGTTRDYYVVPVDQCYKLVGLIRTHWRGLSGGTEVWRELKQFFDKLKAVSSPLKEATHA